jgi:hypothetical protein
MPKITKVIYECDGLKNQVCPHKTEISDLTDGLLFLGHLEAPNAKSNILAGSFTEHSVQFAICWHCLNKLKKEKPVLREYNDERVHPVNYPSVGGPKGGASGRPLRGKVSQSSAIKRKDFCL